MSPPLGAHVSVAGGLPNAFKEAERLGLDSLQLFVKNQRQWKAAPLDEEVAREFRAVARASRVRPLVAHASYLLNLGSPERPQWKRSVDALVDEVRRCDQLGVPYLVLHPGAHMGKGEDEGIRRIVDGLDAVHEIAAGAKTKILLETTAGQGTNLGHRFEQLAAMLDGVAEPDRIGFCLDTCHVFAAGYDFRTEEGYADLKRRWSRLLGVRRLRCIHVNDSKVALGSRVDRHEHIGKGEIGSDGFARFLQDRSWASVPMILETPKGKDGRGRDLDLVNLDRLRKLSRQEGVKR